MSIDGGARPSLQLTRRSLVAAATILATVGPAAASKAFASKGKGHGHGRGRGHYQHGKGKGKGHDDGPGHRCFLSGTRVLTPAGEIPVEELEIGGFVLTKNGVARDIRWIGTTVFERDSQRRWAEEVRPIRIARDAIGPGCPHRDLYLSQWHMLFFSGFLIPARDLVNGRTIAAVDPDVEQLRYFHIEFDRHDILLAEGVPCESLLATSDSRASFRIEHIASGDLEDMTPCAPIAAFEGGRSALKSRLRSALAPVIDMRQPRDVVRDHLEARALQCQAA
jgi:hypothetical protein